MLRSSTLPRIFSYNLDASQLASCSSVLVWSE